MEMNLDNVRIEQIERCIDICNKCIEVDEKIIEETRDIIRRYEENMKIVEMRLAKTHETLAICGGALQLKMIKDIISKEEA